MHCVTRGWLMPSAADQPFCPGRRNRISQKLCRSAAMKGVFRGVNNQFDAELMDYTSTLSARLSTKHPCTAQFLAILGPDYHQSHVPQLALGDTLWQQVQSGNLSMLCHGPGLLPPSQARDVRAQSGARLAAQGGTWRDNPALEGHQWPPYLRCFEASDDTLDP